MYKKKYLLYKNKYLNLKKLIGGAVPNCIREHHDNLIKDLKTTILPVDTFLLHGNGLFNNLDVSTYKVYDDINTKEIKFFNTTYEGSVSYSLTNKIDTTDPGYIGLYQVISPIQVYAQNPRISQFYFDRTHEYKSEKVQCLCNDGYNGYCSYDNLDAIKKIYDIGLCNYLGKIKLIGYVQVKIRDQDKVGSLQVYKYNVHDVEPYINENNLFLVNDKPITMGTINMLNQNKIDEIYDGMVDVTE